MQKPFNKITYFQRLPYTLTAEQRAFCEVVYDPNNIAIFCNARAGTSKTTLAVGMGLLMAEEFKLYDEVLYIVSPCEEGKLGFQPGTVADKTRIYMEPVWQAVEAWGYEPYRIIKNAESKEGDGIIETVPHTFLRGRNFDKKFVILDEAQNYSHYDLKKTLTRVHDNCKIVVIGHNGQIDLKRPQESGFRRYLEEAKEQSFCKVVELKQNYRGIFSNWADSVN